MRNQIIMLAIFGGLLSTSESATGQVKRLRFGGEGGLEWGEVARINTFMDVDTTPGSIQPWELDPNENILPKLDNWARWPTPRDPLWRPGQPRIWRWHRDVASALDWDPRLLVDGDPATGMAARRYHPHYLAVEYYTIDLGTEVPLERFSFTPKAGTDELTGEPFSPGYALRNFEISAGKEADLTAIAAETDFIPLSLSTLLTRVEGNFEFRYEIEFPLQNFRLFRHRAMNDQLTSTAVHDQRATPYQEKYGLGELELYGRGFVPKVRWESQVVDLGEVSNIGDVLFGLSRWRKEGEEYVHVPDLPVGASVEVKTGLDETPTLYYTYDQMGKLVEASEDTYTNNLKTKQWPWHPDGVGWRGPIADDTDSWSSWSAPLRSSGNRPRLPRGRFVKVSVTLETESLWEFARMESLVVVASPLLAARILGEVAVAGQLEPEGNVAQVRAGEETEFIYDIRAEFTDAAQTGFDAVRISTPSVVDFIGLEMGDPPTPADPDSVVEDALGFSLFLPRTIDPAGDDRLRVRLETTVYDAAAEVSAEVFGRSGDNLPQRVEAGDASAEVGTDQQRVLALSSSLDNVLGDVRVQPRAFTPQGDGVNDRVGLAYTLFSVRSTQVDVRVYTLDGRSVRQIFSGPQSAGQQLEEWDGRDDGGETVSPGLYLLRVDVDTDGGSFTGMHPVAVAY